jgi:flagellar hook-basal body complex protein FliE
MNQIDAIFRPIELTPQKGQSAVDGARSQSFEEVLKGAISDVNKLQNSSDKQVTSLLKGESQDLHGTILAVQQADTSFKLMMQVRNKIVEAYKEIARSGM